MSFRFDEQTIGGMFRNRALNYKKKILFRYKREGDWQIFSWARSARLVEDIGLGLLSLGVRKGDIVGLLSNSRPEWALCDLAVLSIGAVDMPIYPTNPSRHIERILKRYEVQFLIAEDTVQVEKLIKVKKSLPRLKHIICIDPCDIQDEMIIDLQELGELGREKFKSTDFEDHLKEQAKDDLATIIYTSGTTGDPKGIMLSHDNLISNCRSILAMLPLREKDFILSFLPLAYCYERICGLYAPVMGGMMIAYQDFHESFEESIKEIRPTFLIAVPHFLENLYYRILSELGESSFPKEQVFQWALESGKRLISGDRGKTPIPGFQFITHGLAEKFVLQKVRERLGGRVRFIVCSAAPLSREIAEFFHAVGLPVLEAYGLVETASGATLNRPDDFKVGTVGKPFPGTEVKIAEDGEILIRGPQVMQGYYMDPETTDQILKDGWFYTGDLGWVDEEGFLSISGRKKNIFISTSGKNIYPQSIEKLLKLDPYIEQAIVFGEGRNYVTALIVPNFKALEEYAREMDIPFSGRSDLVESEEIMGFMMLRVNASGRELAPHEKVKKIALLERDFSLEKGEVTPTGKLCRNVVAKKNKRLIESLYTS